MYPNLNSDLKWIYNDSKYGTNSVTIDEEWKELKVVISVNDSYETLTIYITRLEIETNKPDTTKIYWIGLNSGGLSTYAKISINVTTVSLCECIWYGNDVTASTRTYYFIKK